MENMLGTILMIIGAITVIAFLIKLGSKSKDELRKVDNLSPQNEAQERYDYFSNQGKFAFKRGSFEEALKYFEKAYEAVPEILLLVQMAGCHKNLENHQKCIGLCNAVIEKDASIADAYLMRSSCNLSLNHKQKAIADLNKFVELVPGKKDEINNLIEEIKVAEEGDVPDISVSEIFFMVRKASEYRKQGEFDKAIEVYKNLIQLNDTPKIYQTIIETFMEKKDFPNAIDWCKKGFDKHPNSPELFTVRSYMSVKIKDFKQAMSDYNKLCEISPVEGRRLREEGFVEYLEEEKLNDMMNNFR